MPDSARPKVFCIGLPHSGGRTIASLFKNNGYTWAHHEDGKIAQDIAFAQATDFTPLQPWPDAVGFSGLYHLHKRHLPPVYVDDVLAFLYGQFPDAYFINTTLDSDVWITTQFWAHDGDHRIAAAWHAQVQLDALPTYWADEHAKHNELCHQLFDENPRFLNFNATTQPIDEVCEFLKIDFNLPVTNDLLMPAVVAGTNPCVTTYLKTRTPVAAPRPADMSFVAQVTDFCMQTKGRKGKAEHLSAIAIAWHDDNFLTNKWGDPVAISPPDTSRPSLSHPKGGNLERALGALNELVAHGARPPLHIDMMDARFLGTAGRRHAPRSTVTFNRRRGATNLTLWPLPEYQTLAPRGAVGGFPSDDISFENKQDRCVWLGNLTGRMSPALTPDHRQARGVYAIRDQMKGLAHDDPQWDAVIDDLMCVPRYNLVKTLMDHPDFDVGLVLRSKWKPLARTPALQGLNVPIRPRTWFQKFRYVLSLAGNDMGSNFLSAASSNALILKEEDDWELFYSGAFKPWVHYVPLAEGAQDVIEKLDWARANPQAAKSMADAATHMYDKFANPNNRRAILQGITARLNTD